MRKRAKTRKRGINEGIEETKRMKKNENECKEKRKERKRRREKNWKIMREGRASQQKWRKEMRIKGGEWKENAIRGEWNVKWKKEKEVEIKKESEGGRERERKEKEQTIIKTSK